MRGLPLAVRNQRAAAAISVLHGGKERPEDMPRSCEGCGHCCGRMLVTDMADNRRIERYANRHHLEPTDDNTGGQTGYEQLCGWLDTKSGKCRIYPARPRICRCWGSPHDGPLLGTNPGQPCGLRADMMDVWEKHGVLGDYDTWKSEWSEFR